MNKYTLKVQKPSPNNPNRTILFKLLKSDFISW